MRILHVVPSYLPAYRYGGPILSVHTMNKWLVRAGIEVTVFTTNADGKARLAVPLSKETIVDGVKVWYFPVSFPVRWTYSSALRRALAARVGEFDLVHITSVFLAVSMLAARYAKAAGVPYVISPRGSLMKEPLARKSALLKRVYIALVERRNLSGAAAIHFTSAAEEEEYAAEGLPAPRKLIIPNGLDAEAWRAATQGEFRSQWKVAAGRKIVLSMGRIGWKKGFDTLIPAFARVVRTVPDALLVVSGSDDDGYRATVERLVRESGLQSSVLFTGPFDGLDARALADADVFVLPSYSENFGMAVGQAMFAGVPVVVTTGVALSRDVERAGAGLVVEKDERAVAEAIIQTLNNREAARNMGAEGKVLAATLLAPAVAETFKKAYAEIITAS
jgi:glycosyltransferase involved in cell wall biosynthesis